MIMRDRTWFLRPSHRLSLSVGLAMTSLITAAPGCSSSDNPQPPPTQCMSDGGALPGMATDMCMGMFKTVGMCMPDVADDGGMGTDAGTEPLPDPAVGTSNYDDDCKYKVSFTYNCVQKGSPGTVFVVSLKSAMNDTPVPGADAYIEAFTGNHPAGGSTASDEPTPGTYRIGPVVFDRNGQWTVRFHFFGNCSDKPEDSPHGHAAFLINVP
jgi:hypothetical protein